MITPEPMSFGAEDVATFLENAGRPGFASLVRSIARRDAEATKRHDELIRDYNALVRRYEPRPKAERDPIVWTGD